MTTNVKMTDTEMIDDPSEEDYVRKPKFIQPPENFATLSEKNVREIERARKTLEQNKTEEKKEKKNKKKLKNIEAMQQQMTTNVKTTDTEMIDDSSKENYVRKPKFIQPPKNFAILSEKNVREIEYARKTLEQNKTEEKKEKKNKKKLKNIGATQQQITAHVKVPHNEIITKPNAADHIGVPIYIPQSENFATLSEKDVRKIKHVSEKLEQNKEKLKDIEVTQEQTTTNIQTAGVQITHVPSKIDDEENELYAYLKIMLRKSNIAHEKLETATNFTMQKIDTKNILKTEGEKQEFNCEDQHSPLSILSLLSPVSLLSPLSSSPPSNSSKDYTTPVTSQMITMEEQDYNHIIPRTNINEESEKVELSKQIDWKKFYADSLLKLLTDFKEMKRMLNINIIKIKNLLEELLESESK